MGVKMVNSVPKRKFITVTKANINLYQESSVDKAFLKEVSLEEAYILETFPTEGSIKITSPTTAGAFYAFQSLSSVLFKPEVEDNTVVSIVLPKIRIVDAPRFPYRGLHLGKKSKYYYSD